MTVWQVGQQVELVEDFVVEKNFYTLAKGRKGDVKSARTDGYVYVSFMGGDHMIPEDYLKPVESASVDNNPVSPNHYRFPGGAEVIQISEHLTSNGGQAVQYVARATRLDGQIKGNAIEDLEKAAFFIQREIDRLKESK